MLTRAELQDARNAAKYWGDFEERRLASLQRAQTQFHGLRKRLNVRKLVAVHLTNYFPSEGVLKPRGQAKFMTYSHSKVYFPRETLHFTLNGPVSSHGVNVWDGCKFAILIPLHLIINRFYNLSPEDAYLLGKLKLPKGSEILGKQSDLGNKNPGSAQHHTILPSETIHEAVRRRIVELGYIPATITKDGWNFSDEALAMKVIGNSQSLKAGSFDRLVKDLGKTNMRHMNSLFSRIEDIADKSYAIMYKGFMADNQRIVGEYQSEAKKAVEEIAKIRRKKTLRTAIISNEELLALERLESVMNHLYHELGLVLRRIIANYNEIKDIDSLNELEVKWLLREFSVVKNIKKSLGDKHKSKRFARVLGRIEKKAYRVYRKLMNQIKKLESDNTFTLDLSDIKEQVSVWESFLATALSKQTGKLDNLIVKGKWDEVATLLQKVEGVIGGIETILQEFGELLRSRELRFSRYL